MNRTKDGASAPCRVTIIIKALNEEKRIVASVVSALAAVQAVGGEVVLSDSCSSDKTVALASAYPIRIVQLGNATERCCGVGPELGYQHSEGDFVYILDGDMEILPDFLPEALAFMQEHPDVAGVGGHVVEMNTTSLEYLARVERGMGHMRAGEVDRLDMGGLYRRTAVEQTGYFSDRNLHSYEEFDLAVRLRSKGWKLWRIASDSVRHHGHDAPPYQLLMRRWHSGYICGLGEVVRAAWGKPHLKLVLTGVRELRIYLAVLVWWLLLIAMPLLPITLGARVVLWTVVALAPLLLMTWRKRNISKALFSVVSWCFNTGGLLRGIFTPRRSITIAIPSKEIATLTEQQKCNHI